MESNNKNIGLDVRGSFRYSHPRLEWLTSPRKPVWWISNMGIYPLFAVGSWLLLAIALEKYWEHSKYLVWALWGVIIVVYCLTILVWIGCFDGKRFKYIIGAKHVYLIDVLVDTETWQWSLFALLCENKPQIELSESGVRYLKFECEPIEKEGCEWFCEFYVKVADNIETVEDLLMPKPTRRVLIKDVAGCTDRLLGGVVKLDRFVKGVPFTSPLMTFETHPSLKK